MAEDTGGAMTSFLGVEIGGTKLQATLADEQGNLLRTERVKAQAEGGRPALCFQLEQLVASLLDSADDRPARIGVGFGGPIDADNGTVVTSHQVAGWDDFPLVAWFQERFGIHTVLGNDSDLAGWAEACVGAGRGLSPVVYMNIGSGIGGAIVVDGKLFSAQGHGAAEIGHLRVRPCPSEPTGPWQTLEDLCSGWNLAKQAQRAAEENASSRLMVLAKGDPAAVTTEALVAAVQAGDQAAGAVWSEATRHLGVAVANVITLVCPQCVVLGGGVAGVGQTLLGPLQAEVGRQVFAPFRDRYQIVAAQLGDEVVLHGAILLARG